RIPSLDGLRAASILLVIVSHLSLPIPVLAQVDYGNLGVRIFFVISGFLITALLLGERETTGHISIRCFYARRFFRIVPAYYTFLLVMALLIPSGWIRASFAGLLPAATFSMNYVPVTATLVHSWSLSVEEQFYLLWPGALVLLGLRRSMYGCVTLLFTAPIFRELSMAGLWPTPAVTAFESVCDALAVGCLLAILREQLWSKAHYRACVSSPYVLLIPAVALACMAIEPTSTIVRTLSLSMLNIGIALSMDRYMRFPQSIVGRALNLAPIVWIGTISYSLYLWQQPLMFNTLHLQWYVKIAGCFACGAASFYWVERPGLALRRSLSGDLDRSADTLGARMSCRSRTIRKHL
ncbi:MAG: acyltransferase family protein, partial [Steroidobacteraceae bacterium]